MFRPGKKGDGRGGDSRDEINRARTHASKQFRGWAVCITAESPGIRGARTSTISRNSREICLSRRNTDREMLKRNRAGRSDSVHPFHPPSLVDLAENRVIPTSSFSSSSSRSSCDRTTARERTSLLINLARPGVNAPLLSPFRPAGPASFSPPGSLGKLLIESASFVFSLRRAHETEPDKFPRSYGFPDTPFAPDRVCTRPLGDLRFFAGRYKRSSVADIVADILVDGREKADEDTFKNFSHPTASIPRRLARLFGGSK